MYCGDNYVLDLVYFPLYLLLYNILKYSRQLFTSVGKVTAQQGWQDISTIYIHDICNENIISDIYLIFQS